MRVTVELAGFGPDRPAVFGGIDRMDLTVADGAVVADALAGAHLADTPGVSVLVNGAAVAAPYTTTLYKNDTVTILYALEGG